MSILITGSSGFLGNIIRKSFKDELVFGLNRNSGNYHCKLEKVIPTFNKTFDLIIHAAGKAHTIPKTETEKQDFYDVNVRGTQNLFKGLEKNDGLPKQFVFISSVSVYGAESGQHIDEKTPLMAKDAYALSKIAAEELVTDWCNANQVICTVLRLPLVVGANPPGNLGSMIKAIDKRYYVNIGGGVARKSMIVAQDVGRFITLVAPIGGVYNLTDGINPNFKELSTAISVNRNKKIPFNLPLSLAKILGLIGDLFGNRSPINSLKVKKITSTLTFDDSKARAIKNWRPQSVLAYINNNHLE
jgi:nucleoside-diphosphate-sugar epimerase